MRRRTHTVEPLLRFVATLARHRYPRTVPAIAAEAGVSRPVGYRYVAEIERLGVFPLIREPDPQSPRGQLVGIDWRALRGMG